MSDPWELEPDGLVSRDSLPYAHEKLHYAGHYMQIFATGMKNIWEHRTYLDLMAGCGRCSIENREYAGSPLRSLPAPFTHRVFVESDAALAAVLRQRVGNGPTVLAEDCNSPATIATLRAAVPANGLGLAFVDNLGLSVALQTLRQLTTGRRIDLMIVFQLQAITRNVFAMLDGKQDAGPWDAFFGTTRWRQVAADLRQQNLSASEIADGLLSFYIKELAGIGYGHVTRGIRLMKNEKNATQYRLLLAGKHARAVDFFKKIEKIEYGGQRLLW